MSKQKTQGIGFFEKFLTVWVILCMIAGILVGSCLYGGASPVALATIVGVLVEVPVMLVLVRIANKTKSWFPEGKVAK